MEITLLGKIKEVVLEHVVLVLKCKFVFAQTLHQHSVERIVPCLDQHRRTLHAT